MKKICFFIIFTWVSCQDLNAPIKSDGFVGKWQFTWLYTTAPYIDTLEIVKISDNRVQSNYGGSFGLLLDGTIDENLIWTAKETQQGNEIGTYEMELISPDSMLGTFIEAQMIKEM
ncbi:MAG: hypothetical protein R2791_15885 [Saprospiraceae bacterium]